MSTQSTETTAQVAKKTVSGVTFTSTSSGTLDETKLDPDEHTLSEHYLYGSGDTKADYSFPVVDASGDLRSGNVSSAWDLRGHAPDKSDAEKKLKRLANEFDSDPLPDSAYEDSATATERTDRFERVVEIAKTDDEQQIAYGAALVPNRVDHQGDFFRAETIELLADEFEERVADRDAVPGVMHSVFPDHVDLVESRLLDEDTTLGERELPAGTWVQSWQYNDDELWELVSDGVLGGNSIGGTIGNDWILYQEGDHPDDVEFPDEVVDVIEDAGLSPEDLPIREIKSGRILETSAVDFPAVPDATHESYKSLEKGHPALTSSIIDARLYLESRGHDPEDAKRLADYLDREKSREPSGWIERAKRFFTRDSDTVGSRDTELASKAMDETEASEKGQTLSEENLTRGMAIHDISLDLLGTEIDHGREKFATDSSVDFAGVAYVQPEETDSGGSGTAFSAVDTLTDVPEETASRTDTQTMAAESAAGTAEKSDPTTTELLTDMSDDDKHELIERIETLEAAYEGDESDTAQTSPDDSGTEPTDKDTASNESDTAAAVTETLERVVDTQSALESQIEQQAETQQRMLDVLERMASAQGVSQQADVSGGAETKTWDRSPFAVGGGN